MGFSNACNLDEVLEFLFRLIWRNRNYRRTFLKHVFGSVFQLSLATI